MIAAWEKVPALLTALLSAKEMLDEISHFRRQIQNFIDQTTPPAGITATSASEELYRMSDRDQRDLQDGPVKLIKTITDHVLTFIAEPPPVAVSLPPRPSPEMTRSGTSKSTQAHSALHLILASCLSTAKRRWLLGEVCFLAPLVQLH